MPRSSISNVSARHRNFHRCWSPRDRAGIFVPRSHAFFSYPALNSGSGIIVGFRERANVSEGRWFSGDEEGFLAIYEKLKVTACPHCKATGLLVLHGFLRGYDESSPREKTIRARRIFCSNRNNRQGCGRTFSVWLADKIRTAEPLGRRSVDVSPIRCRGRHQRGHPPRRLPPERPADATHLETIRPRPKPDRSALWPLCQPPELPDRSPRSPAAEVLAHLQAAFPNADCPIAAFQHALRRFLCKAALFLPGLWVSFPSLWSQF